MGAPDETRGEILVVDDDPRRRATLTPSLEEAGFDVRVVANGNAALTAVAIHPPEVVLISAAPAAGDISETLRRIRSDPSNQAVPVIVLADASRADGTASFDLIAAAIDAGADDFLEPPIDDRELLTTIRDALRMRRAVSDLHEATMASQASVGDSDFGGGDPEPAGLAGLAHRLSVLVGLQGVELKGAVFGALVHDIGDLGIPESIFQKPGPLSESEWAAMRRHPEMGENICRSFPSTAAFAPIVRHHHERWDGFGYPDGLMGEAIPVAARIVGLVDAFDAMTHDRPFREAMSVDAALAEIRREAGGQFDPVLVQVFIGLIDRVVRTGISEG